MEGDFAPRISFGLSLYMFIKVIVLYDVKGDGGGVEGWGRVSVIVTSIFSQIVSMCP